MRVLAYVESLTRAICDYLARNGRAGRNASCAGSRPATLSTFAVSAALRRAATTTTSARAVLRVSMFAVWLVATTCLLPVVANSTRTARWTGWGCGGGGILPLPQLLPPRSGERVRNAPFPCHCPFPLAFGISKAGAAVAAPPRALSMAFRLLACRACSR